MAEATDPMTVQDAINLGVQMLKAAQVDGAARDARVLMAACLNIETGRLTLHLRDELTDVAEARFIASIQTRAGGVPVSHILGHRMFYGRQFIVTPDVLDPRPETEELVAAALEVPWSDVLDLGTGSGCILLSLLSERADTVGQGADVSGAALAVATRNADALGLSERSTFERSDWYAAIGGAFDLVVSNPPYIAADEMADLEREVLREPRMALTDEGDGLSCYRIIAAGAPAVLRRGGWLMVEIGPTQGGAVVEMFQAAGLISVQIRTDLDGRDRVVLGQKTQ